MTTRKIKVVKRDAAVPEPPIEEIQPADTERGMSNTVKDWITERRRNSQSETARDKRKFARLSKLNIPSRKPA